MTAVHSHVFIGQGVEISMESLRALVAGGIAFATPEDPAIPAARDGTIFVLHDNPEKEWLPPSN